MELVATGRVVATPGFMEVAQRTGTPITELLSRHMSKDWGEVSKEDWILNDEALKSGERLLSAYKLKDGTKVWVITEHDRSVTTLLLPEEY